METQGEQEEVLVLANRLLQHTGIARYVQNLRQCNSSLFTQLYEALTGSRVPGLVLHAPTSESVKCQAVVDALSRHLHPHITLSHIRGEMLAQLDVMTIRHLLDIFSVLFHLPPVVGEDGERREEEGEADDSNTISNEGLSVISEVVREELGTNYSTDSTAELLRPVPRARLPHLHPSRSGEERKDSSSTTMPSSSYSAHLTNSNCSDRADQGLHPPGEGGRVGGRRPLREVTPLSITTMEDTTDTEREGPPTPTPVESFEMPARTQPSRASEAGKPPLSAPLKPAPSSTQPCTPPRGKVLRPPLHHSTPHTSTRSRVFETRVPHPPNGTAVSGAADRRQAVSPDHDAATPRPEPPRLLSNGGGYYYTELTHPPRLERGDEEREPVRVTRGPHSAPEGLARAGDGGVEARLRDERLRVVSPGQSPRLRPINTSKISSATQTDSPRLSVHSGRDRDQDFATSRLATTSPDRPQPSGPRVRISSPPRHRGTGEHGGTGTSDVDREEGELHQRLDLEGRIARTRASVLSRLYQNYLKEMKKSSRETRTSAGRSQTPKKSRVTAKPRPSPAQPKTKRQQGGRPPSPSPPPSGEPSDSSSGKDSEPEYSGDETSIPRPKATPRKVAVGDDMLPLVEDEFPFVHVSPSTMRRLWQRQLQQITALTRPQPQRSTAMREVAEMDRKNKALVQAIRKELDHTRRLQRQLEQRNQTQAVKSSIRARRQATARARKYYNEYELRLKAKMQRRRTKEEQIFRQAFEDGLELQRERVRELRRYAKERKQKLARQQHDQLESMENYYQDQFAMLAESIAKEREDVAIREKAQTQLVRRLHRELRQRIEQEIEQLQECLDREEDVAHFRQLDAQQLHHKLSKMTFTTSVK